MASGAEGELFTSKVDPSAKCGKRAKPNAMNCAKSGKWVQGGCAKMKSDFSAGKGFVCEGFVFQQ